MRGMKKRLKKGTKKRNKGLQLIAYRLQITGKGEV